MILLAMIKRKLSLLKSRSAKKERVAQKQSEIEIFQEESMKMNLILQLREQFKKRLIKQARSLGFQVPA